MSLSLLIFLRLLHIVLGVFWVGAVAFIAFMLVPTVRDSGPAGGAVMQRLMTRGVNLWLMAASILTVLSGLALYWHNSAGFSSTEWLASGPGRTFGLGAVLAFIGIAIGMGVNSRAAKQLGAVMGSVQAAGRPPSPDEAATIERLQDRLAKGGVAAAVLLLLAAAAMAVARYT
ncbi:MAG TPA: hypothetical protein VJQ46_00475 [Gemmatimonadales bacterium]|nr:hypothetical protein [Gemmatimonadales bacterium]